MDPTATLIDLIDALNEADVNGALLFAESLRKWLAMGGAMPSQTIGHGLNRAGMLMLLDALVNHCK